MKPTPPQAEGQFAQSSKSFSLWQGGKMKSPGSIHQYVTRAMNEANAATG
ncbi:hypothetical protein PQM29_003112 [Morganella morganii]|nr:hypothetical protein [Morganella morganii]CDK66736.1 hypothetical protein [Morganella morganii IS15]EKW8487247.1 hypothetical protein [Morganella morganii]EME8471248.1 hypothetical protein [Morganella morganii]MDF5912854.1 hypothetical protein [Morganella morganii]HEI8486837.1 hypothetical protein [Morganella morganii]